MEGSDEPKVADTGYTGVQVTAAMSIVERVALGDLPRHSGVEMLVEFFQLEKERAEAIMGAVGNTFSVEKPEPKPFGEPPVRKELDDMPPEGEGGEE